MKAGGRGDDGCRGMHHVADAGQQFAAQAAAGMIAGEVHRFELNGFDDGDGQCITHGHGGQGRGSRGQVVRAHFALNGDVKPDAGVFGQGRFAVAGHGDDFVAEGFQTRDQLDQFFGLAAVADQDQYVARFEHAQIAMESFGRVQEEAWGAGGSESRDHFFPDQAGLAHAADYGAALATEEQLDSALKLTIETVCHLSDSLRLDEEGFFSDSEVIHLFNFRS